MTQREFGNAIRILWSIDAHELPDLAPHQIRAFLINPVQFFVRADDPTAAGIWKAIEARMAK